MSEYRPKTNDGCNVYHLDEINSMCFSSVWKGTLSCPERSVSGKYILEATGDANLDGRKYVALPIETNLNDPLIIAKYNLFRFPRV